MSCETETIEKNNKRFAIKILGKYFIVFVPAFESNQEF